MDRNKQKIFREKLAANIRKYRAVKNWTQEQLAEAANSSQQYICLIEKCKVKISLEVAQDIADAFDVSLNDLTSEP